METEVTRRTYYHKSTTDSSTPTPPSPSPSTLTQICFSDTIETTAEVAFRAVTTLYSPPFRLVGEVQGEGAATASGISSVAILDVAMSQSRPNTLARGVRFVSQTLRAPLVLRSAARRFVQMVQERRDAGGGSSPLWKKGGAPLLRSSSSNAISNNTLTGRKRDHRRRQSLPSIDDFGADAATDPASAVAGTTAAAAGAAAAAAVTAAAAACTMSEGTSGRKRSRGHDGEAGKDNTKGENEKAAGPVPLSPLVVPTPSLMPSPCQAETLLAQLKQVQPGMRRAKSAMTIASRPAFKPLEPVPEIPRPPTKKRRKTMTSFVSVVQVREMEKGEKPKERAESQSHLLPLLNGLRSRSPVLGLPSMSCCHGELL